MKKLAICILVAMMTFGLTLTASAKEVFEVTLVPIVGGESIGKIEVSERGEVKVEIEGATPSSALDVYFVPSEGSSCLVGTATANEDGEVDTEFDAAWIESCGLENPFVGLFQVGDPALFITGFSLDFENLAIDEPEEEELEEEEIEE